MRVAFCNSGANWDVISVVDRERDTTLHTLGRERTARRPTSSVHKRSSSLRLRCGLAGRRRGPSGRQDCGQAQQTFSPQSAERRVAFSINHGDHVPILRQNCRKPPAQKTYARLGAEPNQNHRKSRAFTGRATRSSDDTEGRQNCKRPRQPRNVVRTHDNTAPESQNGAPDAGPRQYRKTR